VGAGSAAREESNEKVADGIETTGRRRLRPKQRSRHAPLSGAFHRRRTAVAATVIVVLLPLVVFVIGRSPTGATASTDRGTDISIEGSACAPSWKPPASGTRIFEVTNATSSVYSIDLLGADQERVFAEAESIGPRTTITLEARLGPGAYSFACESNAGATTLSAVETVRGPHLPNGTASTPPTYGQIQAATFAYRGVVLARLKVLVSATDRIDRAVDAGDLSTARSLWLPAHLDYERIGAVYGTFGDFDAKINGRPMGLQGGVNDPKFEGFLRLEYGLWHGQTADELRPVADRLDAATHGLYRAFPHLQTPANDLSLRTHEMLENALEFEMTGQTDEGSHTNLATVLANVEGTELALNALAPLLANEHAALVRSVRSELSELATALRQYERPDGSWAALSGLTRSERESLDGSLDALLERLAVIPDLLELPVQPATTDG
jgi:iron uptake system EfeUOB component EfeO/EfeM